MNPLLLHQIRKELREHCFLLAVWCGLLLLQLFSSFSQGGGIFTEEGNVVYGTATSALALVGIVGLGLGIPIFLGFGDSPCNSEGFIHTRPVKVTIVWGAKVLVLLGAVLLPASLVPAVLSIVEGAGMQHTLAAAWDRAALMTPAMLFLLFWGGLCATTSRLAGLTVAATAIIIAAIFGIFAFNYFSGRESEILNEPGSMESRLLIVLWIAAAVAAVTLHRQIIGRRRPLADALSTAGLVAIAIALVFSLPGLNFLLPQRQLNTDALSKLSPVEATPNLLSLNLWEDTIDVRNGKQSVLRMQSKMNIENVDNDFTVEPTVRAAELAGADGFRASYSNSSLDRRTLGTVSPTADILRVIRSMIGTDIALYHVQRFSSFREPSPVAIDWDDTPQLRAQLDRELTLDLQLRLDCATVEPLGAIPFKPGQQVNDGKTTLELEMAPLPPHECHWFAMRTRMPQLWLTRNVAKRQVSDWNLQNRYVSLLVNSEQGRAIVCNVESVQTTRGMLSSLPEKVFLFQHWPDNQDTQNTFGPDFYAGAKLHVFRLRWLGTLDRSAKIAGLRLKDRWSNTRPNTSSIIDFFAYREAIERLGPIPDSPQAKDVANILRLIDMTKSWRVDPSDPGFQRLLEIGRRDLSLLVKAIDRFGYRSNRALMEALETNVNESDKDLIISAIHDVPEVAQVITNRGWENDARDSLLELLQSRRALPLSALTAIASLNEPETFQLLAEQFDFDPQVLTYEVLHRIPELRESLRATIERRWEKNLLDRADSNLINQSSAQLALRIGNHEAFDFALEVGRRDLNNSAVSALRPVMLLPQRWNDAAEFLKTQDSSDYEFDASRGVFRNRPSN